MSPFRLPASEDVLIYFNMASSSLTFNCYQNTAKKTALYGAVGVPASAYLALGLAGETGEIVDKVKKLFRDKAGKLDEATKQALIKELGDLLWYISEFSRQLGVSLGEVAYQNLLKIKDRKKRGKLRGQGDDR